VIHIDTSALADLEAKLGNTTHAVDLAARALAEATKDHIIEQAHQRLHTRREPYLAGLSLREDGQLYIVALASSADWIEDGMEPRDMRESLLSSPHARTSRDGHRYLVVPMSHVSSSTPAPGPATVAASMHASIRARMQEAGIGMELERDAHGQPRTGLLHRLPGGGPRMRSGHGLFDGLAVYQRQTLKGVTRDAMTFRVVSDKSPDGSWNHPGMDGVKIFDEAARWAEDQWERVVGPELLVRVCG